MQNKHKSNSTIKPIGRYLCNNNDRINETVIKCLHKKAIINMPDLSFFEPDSHNVRSTHPCPGRKLARKFRHL